ncbi:MAG: response regulator [Lachnospiraceae bacterium]|nr:response regulator [Lachnospiraceae bacterium]
MTILCVDASPIALFELGSDVKKILPDAAIHLCRNAAVTYKTAKTHGCDILITDIDFGKDKEEGIILAEKMLEEHPNLNVIFASAGSVRDYADRLMKIRYSGYLTKPYTMEGLKNELSNLRFEVIEPWK